MHRNLRAALVASVCFTLAAAPVAAQTTEVAPAPAADPTPVPEAAPDAAAPAEAPAAPAPAPDAAASPAETGPGVTFVKHVKPFSLVDTTAGSAAFGMVGAIAAISRGHDIANDNDVVDPSDDIGLAIATAWATSKGGHVVLPTELSYDKEWNKTKGEALVKLANGARYIVDVGSSGNLIYFSFDWTHYDLMFSSAVRIIDTSNGKVVAKASCFQKPDKTIAKTHDEMIDNGAAMLKQRIAEKSQACVAQLKTKLKI